MATSTLANWLQTAVAEAQLVAADSGERGLFQNADFIGQFKAASILVPQFPQVVLASHTAGTANNPTTLTHSSYTITLNNHRAITVHNDIFEQSQATESLEEYTKKFAAKAVQGMRDAIDATLATLITDVPAANYVQLATNSGITDAAVVVLVRLMNNTDMPEQGRWMCVSPTQEGVLASISTYQNAAALGGLANTAGSVLQNGRLGMIRGLSIFRSKNILTEIQEATANTGAPTISTGGELSGSLAGVFQGKGGFNSVQVAAVPIMAPPEGTGVLSVGGEGLQPRINVTYNTDTQAMVFQALGSYGVTLNASGTNANLFGILAQD